LLEFSLVRCDVQDVCLVLIETWVCYWGQDLMLLSHLYRFSNASFYLFHLSSLDFSSRNLLVLVLFSFNYSKKSI
jgi:hypothetical protein